MYTTRHESGGYAYSFNDSSSDNDELPEDNSPSEIYEDDIKELGDKEVFEDDQAEKRNDLLPDDNDVILDDEPEPKIVDDEEVNG